MQRPRSDTMSHAHTRRLFHGLIVLAIAVVTACSDNATTPTAPSAGGAGRLEGQLVADIGATAALHRAAIAPVYPISGVTVQLVQDGVVVATATTDEYGRFLFANLAPGTYRVVVVTDGVSVAHDHVVVNPDATVTVFGRVMSGTCLWDETPGPQWDSMPAGTHWGNRFPGASPGQGYWYDGQQWCTPVGSGPHGPRP